MRYQEVQLSADVPSESEDPQPELVAQDVNQLDQEPKAAKIPRPKGKTKAKPESRSRFNPEQQTVT